MSLSLSTMKKPTLMPLKILTCFELNKVIINELVGHDFMRLLLQHPLIIIINLQLLLATLNVRSLSKMSAVI